MILFKNILRWLFCIPLGVIGGMCVQLLYELVSVYLNRYIEPGSFMGFIQILIAGGLGGAAGVYIAAYVAPSHRIWVAIFISVISAYNVYISFQVTPADWPSVSLTVAQTVGAACLTLLVVRKRVTFPND